MLKIVIGRYLLFGILGVETLLLPFFLTKETYGEIEFLKFTAFLAQFALFGSGTGYVVQFLKAEVFDRLLLSYNFILFAVFHGLIIGIIIVFFESWVIAILSFSAIVAMSFESIIKVREKYLLAMSFKPILSLILILLLPLMINFNWKIDSYVLNAFIISTIIFASIIFNKLVIEIWPEKIQKLNFGSYVNNITSGFVINISTAMIFAFFYIDRAIVRSSFPDKLGDYSLSYAIMQLTIVAITTFSYVNLVEFGKEKSDIVKFKEAVFRALRLCFILYVLIGACSIVFSYWAETFYNYDAVFETTLLMVGLFGFANVLSSLNAAHLYLGSVNFMTCLMVVFFIISISLNFVIPFDTVESYYILLAKTYGLFLLFSMFSFLYICYKLRTVTNTGKV